MANPFPRGSEWRKWDLHVHAPGTMLNDNYKKKNGAPDLEQFCEIIHDSEVAAIAIADYFSLDGYFATKSKYDEMYPDDQKLLLPNLELRLPISLNKKAENVNIHLVFRPTLTATEADTFLRNLKTEGTTGAMRKITCKNLSSRMDYESATVSIESIEHAIKETFGEHAVHRSERSRHLLVICSAKGDGMRVGGQSGRLRKNLLSDEVDKYSDGFYATGRSRDYFLGTNRLEGYEPVAPKPVFDGCDAHSFEDLLNRLGKHVSVGDAHCNITWIKADPTYSGLLQTLIEPAERVAIQAAEPDQKEPYKLIQKVTFRGSTDFPSEVLLNPNLNSIIGSRSSGKSALLAFIAHAVDPEGTVRVQVDTAGWSDDKQAGPAAGFPWSKVAHVTCEVEWKSGDTTSGKVIYIPQNSLYALSEKPDKITKKIAPALFRSYPTVKTAYSSAKSKVNSANDAIRASVNQWFDLQEHIEERTKDILDLGDKRAITAERDRLQGVIDTIKAADQLTDQEVAQYQEIAGELYAKQSRLEAISVELDQLKSYVRLSNDGTAPAIIPQTVEATVTVRPSSVEVPEATAMRVERLKAQAVVDLVGSIESELLKSAIALLEERISLQRQIDSMKTANAGLIAKHEANEELSSVVADHKKQVASLEEIVRREKSREQLIADQVAAIDRIKKGIHDREVAWTHLETIFNAEARILTDLTFGIEAEVTPEAVTRASSGFSQRSVSAYVKNKGEDVAYKDAQADPANFLKALGEGQVKLNKGFEPSAAAADVLAISREVRFTAELDTDLIGGFSPSSMTPGKQALFALTLILNESQEPWPLLIDQPEDDLDSRSIYETIVPYLMKRKKERQIIMVSHNANLVIGADSELVIVANRHGVDRKNQDERTFEYLTGSLEHSQPPNAMSPTVLGRFGIREHACEILDGGEDAFQKRQEKYRVRSDD